MKREIKLGQTDYTVLVFIPDSASTDGSGQTGLAHTDMTVSYARVETDNDVTITDATSSLNNLASLTAAHADWGWEEVSNTLAPGLYRLDIADAVFASGAWTAVVYVMVTASEAAASPMEFVLVSHENADIGAKTDLIPGTQDGQTFAGFVKLAGAVLLGKATGLDTGSPVYRSMDDAADRVSATTSADGNRSAVTLNP